MARYLTPAALALAGLTLLAPVQGPAGNQDEVRAAVARGEIQPLTGILALVERDFGGQVLEVELEKGPGGIAVYEIEILMPGGRVLEVEYDARTGEQLRVEGDDDDGDDD
jgi:uncharacterized membrane protein YkoI